MSGSPTTYVIGASGFVGSAIRGRLVGTETSVRGTARNDPGPGGVTYDFWTDDPAFLDENDVVIFAALVEDDDQPIETFERRVDDLTSACSRNRFVYLSSDAVFRGDAGTYSEADPTAPTTTYGERTARFERYVRTNCSDSCIIRPSYVYGYSRGVLDHRLRRTFRALRSGDEPTYYADMYKSPIEVNQLAEICRRVYESDFCGVVHAGGPRTSVLQFHRRAASAFGAPTDRIEPDAMPSESPHPRDSSLDSSRLAGAFGLQPGGIRESLTCESVEDLLRA